jgi:hypothetical protein
MEVLAHVLSLKQASMPRLLRFADCVNASLVGCTRGVCGGTALQSSKAVSVGQVEFGSFKNHQKGKTHQNAAGH